MAIRIRGSTGSQEDTTVTSHTVGLPSGIISGDTVIVFFVCTTFGRTVTFPSGYTVFFSADGANTTHRIAWRLADGTEGANITVTTDLSRKSAHAAYNIAQTVNPNTTAPQASANTTGTSVNPDPDNLSVSPTGRQYLYMVFEGNNTGGNVITYPTNYVLGQRSRATSGAGNNCNIGTAARFYGGASDNPDVFTMNTSGDWGACTIAVLGITDPQKPLSIKPTVI